MNFACCVARFIELIFKFTTMIRQMILIFDSCSLCTLVRKISKTSKIIFIGRKEMTQVYCK